MKLETLIRETLLLGDDVEVIGSAGPGQLDGWDSLGHVTLIAALESTYSISIGMDEMMAIESVAHIKDLLGQKGVSEF